MSASGRVAGPSWFIRDWWSEKLTDDEMESAREDAVAAWLSDPARLQPAAYEEERGACIDEALEAGAVPGM